MKKTKSILAIICAGALFVACKDAAKTPDNTANTTTTETAAVVGKPETASFNIEGMTCAMGCAKIIESKLAAMEGVTKASVDFEKNSATVSYDSAKQTPEKIAEAVEAVAGGDTYKVTNMKSSQDQASVFNKEKKKKKKAKTDDKKTADKKEGCATEAKSGGCCAGKKPASCSTEKAAM